jgi:predicted DNA-binding transcriptional regulator AlpA
MARYATAESSSPEGQPTDVSGHLPVVGYLRLHQIIGRPARHGQPAIPPLIPVSRSTWWAGVKSGRYPRPTHVLGERITAWRVEDIRCLLEMR